MQQQKKILQKEMFLRIRLKLLLEEQKFLRDELRESLNADSSPNTGAAFLTPPGFTYLGEG
jgi:hypothetical protein